MASAVEKFITSLNENRIDRNIIDQIMQGFEKITDKDKKEKKVQFFIHAMKIMDEMMDFNTRYQVRDACACCKGGWREKAVMKVANECKNKSIEEKIEALRLITHMGNPTLNNDGTIIAGIGGENGCNCACTIFSGAGSQELEEEVSPTYCLCCAGHFRYHFQIALGKKLRTKGVISSALESKGRKPCRFLYEIIE